MTLTKLLQTFIIKFPEGYKVSAVLSGTLQPKGDLPCTLSIRREQTNNLD